MNMKEFLTFRKMITPMIIQALFWLGVAACVILGLILIVAGVGARYGSGGLVLGGVLLLLLGPLVVRIYCEILVVLFRILEALGKIADKIGSGRGEIQ